MLMLAKARFFFGGWHFAVTKRPRSAKRRQPEDLRFDCHHGTLAGATAIELL